MTISRSQAFAIRLAITVILFLILRYLVIPAWYPHVLLFSDGGWQGLRIIIAIDLVLGPLLTLIVFKPGKAGLKFDLYTIAILQVIALSWGIWTVYLERPYVIVYSEGYFKPLTSAQYNSTGAPADLVKQFGDTAPYLIYADLPQDDNELAMLRKQALATRRPLYLFAKYYRPFIPASISTIKKQSLQLDSLLQQNSKNDVYINNKLQHYQAATGALFAIIRSRYQNDIVVFDSKTYTITDVIKSNASSDLAH